MKISFPTFRLWIAVLVSVLLSPLSGQSAVEDLGLAGMPITALAAYGGYLVVGTEGAGVFYLNTSSLPDTNWTNLGLEGEHVSAVYPHKSGPIGWGITAGVFPTYDDTSYIYCNHMGGEFFSNTAGISDSFAVGIHSLAGFPDPTICGEKYAATGGALYRQAFGDTVWNRLLTSTAAEGWGIRAVRTKEHIGGLVLAGGSEGYTGVLLMKSLDFGDTWDHLYPPHLVLAFDFGVNPAGTDVGCIFASDGEVISRSLDGGATWEAVFTEEYVHAFEDICYDPYTGYVFAAGSAGSPGYGQLLYSPDLGLSWSVVPAGDLGQIVDLAFPGDGYLYFAAQNSGIFRLSLATLAVPEFSPIPKTFALYRPYPNPFNPATTLRYDLPHTAFVTLTVYDLLGREVTTLVDGYTRPGAHQVVWDAGHLPSGIYLARFVIPEHARTIKLVLLK